MRTFAFKKPSGPTLLLLALSLLAGLGAAWFARQHIEHSVQQQRQQPSVPTGSSTIPTVLRVVAAHDLAAGVVLDAQQVAVRSFPADWAASGSVSPEQYASALQGQILTSALKAGDAILDVHVRPPAVATAEPAPFSASLGKGRRAITLPIDEVNSASGLLAPGDLIDLYVSFEHQHRRVTAPLLQGVLVLATGQTTAAQSHSGTGGRTTGGPGTTGRYATVTLDTSPEDAIKLVAARQGGTLTALLRQRGDGLTAPQFVPQAVRGDLASLLGLSTPVSPPPAAPRRVLVIYGDQPMQATQSRSASSLSVANVPDLPDAADLVGAWLAETERQGVEHAGR